MAIKVGPIVDQLLRRARDPEGLATNRDQIHTLLTHTQRYVTLKNHAVVSVLPYTLVKRRVVYDIGELSPDISQVVGVRLNGEDLTQTAWRALVRQNREWLRATSATPDTWALLGRNLLVIYPGITQAVAVEIVYIPTTPIVDHPDNDLALTDEHVNELLDCTEGLLWIRNRQFGQAGIAFARTGLNLDG